MSRHREPPLVDPRTNDSMHKKPRSPMRPPIRPPADDADEAEHVEALRRLFPPRPAGVYFVQSGLFVKIGIASDVVLRVAQAATAWNPHDVTPLGWIPEPDTLAALKLEQRLHLQFAALHHRREWFTAAPELLAYIAAHAQPWPPDAAG